MENPEDAPHGEEEQGDDEPEHTPSRIEKVKESLVTLEIVVRAVWIVARLLGM